MSHWKSLPASCDKVAWVDCDVVFANKDVGGTGQRRARSVSLVHLFHERHEVPKDSAPDQTRLFGRLTAYKPLGGVSDRCWKDHPGRTFHTRWLLTRRSTNGLAGRSRRDVARGAWLVRCLHSRRGDRAMLCAALGEFNRLALARDLTRAENGALPRMGHVLLR